MSDNLRHLSFIEVRLQELPMQSFEPGFIERQPISQNILRIIRIIGEYKGKQELFNQQSPQVLKTLQQAVIIQST